MQDESMSGEPRTSARLTSDQRRLERLYGGMHRQLVGYLWAMVGQAAEDVESQVWLEVIDRLPGFVGDEAAFRRWVFATAHRRAIDHHRRWWQRQVRCLPPDAPEFLSRASADGEADTASMAEAIARIRSLPRGQAEVVLLRVVAGLTADEVADVTDRSPGAVRVLQHRALRRLARGLARDPFSPGA
jgi:RNA polymerase sigma-70 factor (ECF subfamily)